MRQRYDALGEEIDIPILYGVSALVTRISVCANESQTKKLAAPEIEKDLRVVNDRAPADRWNLDVLTYEGEHRVRQIVGHVKWRDMRFLVYFMQGFAAYWQVRRHE